MEDIMRILQSIQEDLSKQKQDMKTMEQSIKESINNNIDLKFNLIEAKTNQLENIIEQQQKTIEFLDRQIRSKNIIFFGIEENEKGYENLLSLVLEVIQSKMEIQCQRWEVENVIRKGKKSEKVRPVVVTLTTVSKKIEILKKKKMLYNTTLYVKEDFTPSVLQKRKDLQEELKREREAGKRVFLRYDKIVTLQGHTRTHHTHGERITNKRSISKSPEEPIQETSVRYKEGTKQVPKKNKSQAITNFLRPSQLNFNNQPTPSPSQKN